MPTSLAISDTGSLLVLSNLAAISSLSAVCAWEKEIPTSFFKQAVQIRAIVAVIFGKFFQGGGLKILRDLFQHLAGDGRLLVSLGTGCRIPEEQYF